VLGVLLVISIVLGYIGFASYYTTKGLHKGFWDLLYYSLQLIDLEFTTYELPVTWALQVARLLMPAVAVYTGLTVIAVLFYDHFQLARLRRYRGHVLVVGLGRKGFLLADGLRKRGERVVVVERNPHNEYLGRCRELGIVVVLGNAGEREILSRARITHARCLLAVSGNDGLNAEIAANAHDLVKNLSGDPLNCYAHITDPRLCSLMQAGTVLSSSSGRFRLHFFNVFDHGARLMLWENLPTKAGQASHILVVGIGRMGERLVAEAARRWWTDRRQNGPRLRITLVDQSADDKKTYLLKHYPRLPEACDLIPAKVDIRSPLFRTGAFLGSPDERDSITQAYVCLDDDELGLFVALELLELLPDKSIPVIVRTEREAGLTHLLQTIGAAACGFECVHGFGLLDRVCTPEIILENELQARAHHQAYCDRAIANEPTTQKNPSLVPWNSLDGDAQESNRQEANHTQVKLQALGYGIEHLTDWENAEFKFTPDEVEKMAEMEHERWMKEKLEKGWTYAPEPRNPEKKTNPCLLDWNDPRLKRECKDTDRDSVRRIPNILALAGLQVKLKGGTKAGK
jgi:hypothetical protein